MHPTVLTSFRKPEHRAPAASRPGASVRPSSFWRSGLAVLLLATVVHSPQAAVATGAHEAAGSATQQAPAAGCRNTAATQAALQGIARELKAQGLAFRAVCPEGQARAANGWVVQVRVGDGFKAAKVVRGPLADGHDVDMGTPAGVALAGAQPGAVEDFSPDVQHNREWLRGLMARHQFDNLPDAWWHFARRGEAGAAPARTDIAAR